MDIKVEHLTFGYGGKPIFTDFSMVIPRGKAVCLMGESGCGKTTLLSLLAGRLHGYDGTISGMDGEKIGMVFQEERLCEDFSAKVNVKLGCTRGCYPDGAAPTGHVILEHLGLVGLCDVADRRVSELSGGMRRRVAIVRALLSDSSVLLLDEPFKGLDTDTKQQVIQYVLKQKGQRTLIAVTHDAEEAALLGQTVIRL